MLFFSSTWGIADQFTYRIILYGLIWKSSILNPTLILEEREKGVDEAPVALKQQNITKPVIQQTYARPKRDTCYSI